MYSVTCFISVTTKDTFKNNLSVIIKLFKISKIKDIEDL